MSICIDLRSDTVTRPSAAMRQAIATAEVGDDVWGEDPTVIRLQERVAQLLGKSAALFVPSGSMANQLALLTHTRPGDEVVLGWGSHCMVFESGAGAALAGVQFRVLGDDGFFTAAQLQDAINPDNVHFPPTRLVWVENTHNQGAGRIFPQSELEAIASTARQHGLKIHLDGARLLNAAIASGRPPHELAAPVDSTSICLSKGLGAPVGSVLAGSSAFIQAARRYRKMLGGAMRQVGILAAAGLFALEHNIQRLDQDHHKAKVLAGELATIPGLRIDPSRVETNIVVFELGPLSSGRPLDAAGFIRACSERGVLLSDARSGRIRAVTHLDLTLEDCLLAAKIIREIFGLETLAIL